MANTTNLTIADGDTKIGSSLYQELPVTAMILWTLFLLPAIATNVINIKTFLTIGVDDGVSVSFIALSLSDLFYTLFSFLVTILGLIARLEVVLDYILPINPVTLLVFAYNLARCTYPITAMSTTYLAVARCMCVVRPLQFKHVFTKARSVVIHVCFALLAIGSYAAVFSQMGVRPAFDPSVNATRGMLTLTPIREDVTDVVYFIFDTFLTFATEILMVGCVFVMAESLRKSQQFRQAAQVSKGEDGAEVKAALSGKELLVVKQVVLISAVYVICSLPKMCVSVYGFVEPEFALGKRLVNQYYTWHTVGNVFEIINSGSTMIVYLLFNSKFRANVCKCK